MMVWKMIFLFQGYILRFHVNLPGCTSFFWWQFSRPFCFWCLARNEGMNPGCSWKVEAGDSFLGCFHWSDRQESKFTYDFAWKHWGPTIANTLFTWTCFYDPVPSTRKLVHFSSRSPSMGYIPTTLCRTAMRSPHIKHEMHLKCLDDPVASVYGGVS